MDSKGEDKGKGQQMRHKEGKGDAEAGGKQNTKLEQRGTDAKMRYKGMLQM